MTHEAQSLDAHPSDLTQEVELLRERLAMADAWMASANEWVKTSRELTREAQARAESATTWAHRSALRIQEEELKTKRALAELAEVQRRSNELVGHIHALTHSASWRISLPIRILSRAARKALRLLRRIRGRIARERAAVTVRLRKQKANQVHPHASDVAPTPSESLMAPVANAQHVLAYVKVFKEAATKRESI